MSEPEIIKFIQKSYEQLKSQKDLSPRNETVNRTLNQLVLRLIEQNTCSSDFCNRLLGSRALKKIVERIRKISYKAECEMEKILGRKICRFPHQQHQPTKRFLVFQTISANYAERI